ncbi:metalloregulator ArsR/SmtB family transcription factor [Rhizobium sp. 0TCS1.26]|uniref:ArsR/SmtB family transcription factor n=1 Tax=Rhizobium sp. 0TCS1.26 TaxID=3142623 RepID=UPI003D26B4CA
MVEIETHEVSAVFHALGDSTRRRMLLSLSSGPRTVSELAEPFDMSLAAASKHIKVLEAAGLVRREVRGRTHVCRLKPEPLADAHAWLSFYEGFWNGRLENMQRLLRAEAAASPSSAKQRGNRSKASGTD